MHIAKVGSANGTASLEMYRDVNGISFVETLPLPEFDEAWSSIFIDGNKKEQLLNQAVLSYTLRNARGPKLPLHGIIVLYGPPGTGKTTLARGCASQVAKVFDPSPFVYVEVDPHALGSSALGKSQKAVTDLFGTTLLEISANRQVIVLLDEVETLAAARSRMSLEANPIDVHRATDAILTQVDALARSNSNILFIATSNFPEAIDSAFLSRADLLLYIDTPSTSARREIILDTIRALARHYPKTTSLCDANVLDELAKLSEGLDGRTIRKAILSSLSLEREVALHPDKLTVLHLRKSFEAAHKQIGEKK